MTTQLAMSPEAFQTIMLAWIGVLTVLVGALGVFAPKVIALIQQVKDAWSRLDQHRADINSNQKQITEIALASAPPAQQTPREVIVANPASDPIPTKEATSTKQTKSKKSV